MDQEKNDKEKETGTRTDTKHKLGPPQENYVLGERGKLVCKQQSPIDEKLSKSVPPSSNEDGPSLAVGVSSHFLSVRNGV